MIRRITIEPSGPGLTSWFDANERIASIGWIGLRLFNLVD